LSIAAACGLVAASLAPRSREATLEAEVADRACPTIHRVLMAGWSPLPYW
jgi:hypothetical protein